MKKFLALALTLAMSISMFAGCSSSGDDTLIVAVAADPVSLDPVVSNDTASNTIFSHMYETIFAFDDDMVPQANLVETYEFNDESTVITAKLHEGVLFHNGEELKASDVKFTIERVKASSAVSSLAGAINSVNVIDDYTFEIVLEYAYSPILSNLSHAAFSIVNEKAVTEAGDSYADNPVGTGAYQFSSISLGDNVQMTRFEDYWGEAAKIENVMFRVITETSSRLLELESGGVHIAYDISPSDIETLEASDTMTLLRDLSFSTSYIGLNCLKEPFDNVLVRKAINYALDMESIVEAVYYGAGAVAIGPIGERVFGFNTELEAYTYDVEYAKELLAEAGYPDGFSTTLWTNDNSQRIQIAEIAQNQLQAIGIDVTVEILEWSTYLEYTTAGQQEMFMFGWTTGTGDPDYGMYAPFHSSQQGAGGNRTFYTNERVDELLDLGRRTTDSDDRVDIYWEVQEIIWDECPWIFVQQGEYLTGVGEGVAGFVNSPNGRHVLKTVYFE